MIETGPPVDETELVSHAHIKIPFVEGGRGKGGYLADGGDGVSMENTTISYFPVADMPEKIAEVFIDGLKLPGK